MEVKKKKVPYYYIGVSNSIFMKIRSPKVPLRLKKRKFTHFQAIFMYI
jgi:hypothetical protein